jgi:maltose alpha-D-glucosyltransferase/alpha-amylase
MNQNDQADWHLDAVIYQLHVKAYRDSNRDGFGDFQGLIQKLDYIASLGVTALWLLPFYPSPLRDDGYDIAHYTDVHPSYGSIDDFKEFLDAAHKRGLKVITELVINHTSDQHAWFERARRAPRDSPERNFYVWSDDPNKYAGVRLIFPDMESSNWAWDPIAQQFYWHRFFNHQPDLNCDNPAVLDAVIEVMRFWLRLGVDGMRLDAIPYLVEREGTNCETLPETHVVLKKLRAAMDEEYSDRIFLAEANLSPAEVSSYFGNGDECHMAFHFPVMPRIYMAVAQQDRAPIVSIMAQTPAIPAGCQWAIFLRNHDELTLEMVTPEEREFMYGHYANDARMRINVGIRRRLAPLMENGRDEIELMHALLMSLPGSPVMYYGDEIGMGVELWSGQAFPTISTQPYLLTMTGREFYWFRLMPPGGPDRIGAAAEQSA